jgi:HAD superfamily hydrolase (TIGR01490 family)
MLVSYAFRQGLIPASLLFRACCWYLQYKLNIIKDFRSIIIKTSGLLSHLLQQMTVQELSTVFRDCFEQKIKHRIFPDSTTFLNSFRKEGFDIYFVSSTLEPLALLLRNYYGFGHVMASKLEIKDGFYTGRIEGSICFGTEKRQQIEALAKKDGINLAESFAFSDHVSDIPMLEIVGHPVVINPSGPLRKIAKTRKWDVRKLQLKPR